MLFLTQIGSYAEYAVVSSNHIAKMPKGIDFTQANIVVVGASAIQSILVNMKLKSGQNFLFMVEQVLLELLPFNLQNILVLMLLLQLTMKELILLKNSVRMK